MNKIRLLMVVAFAFAFAAQSASADDLLESDVIGIKVNQQVLLMIPGGAPWVVREGEAEVSEDGEFDVELEGFLLLDGTIGPVIELIATLHCRGEDAAGFTEVGRIGPAPLDMDGNADLEGQVVLPPFCIAPIVLVRIYSIDAGFIGGMPGDVIVLEDVGFPNFWIAASGFRSDDDDDSDSDSDDD